MAVSIAWLTSCTTRHRAYRFESASMRYHGAWGVLVRSSMSSTASVYAARFLRLRQSSSVSFHDFRGSSARGLEALLLLLVGQVQPELDEHGALGDQHRLELPDLGVGALPGLGLGELLDPLDQHAAVPGPVVDRHASPAGQLRPEPPQPVMSLLVLGRGRERPHPHVSWVELLDEALDRAALAGGVPALEHDAHRWAEVVASSEPGEPQPERQQPPLLLAQPLLGFLLRKRHRQIELFETSHRQLL